jgi:chemotaxis protein CheD
MNRQIVVGISDCAFSNNSEEVLITFSLGSCIGVSLYDPVMRQGGLVHCLLPTVTMASKNEQLNSSAFVDLGVQNLMQNLLDSGSKKKDLICKIAGCSAMFDFKNDHFKIGEKNHSVAKLILEKNGIKISGEYIGGKDSKTMWLEIKTGKTIVQIGDEKHEI